MKKCLHCIVVRKDGSRYLNELKISEVSLINTLLKLPEVCKVEVTINVVTAKEYKAIFH